MKEVFQFLNYVHAVSERIFPPTNPSKDSKRGVGGVEMCWGGTAVWVADPNEHKPMRSPLPSVEAAQPLAMSMVTARACSRKLIGHLRS